jgi:hypothetical protein
MSNSLPYAFFVGIDWANSKHDVYVIDSQGSSYHGEIEHSTEAIDGFVSDLLSKANVRNTAQIDSDTSELHRGDARDG